jgi:hypothetical protein
VPEEIVRSISSITQNHKKDITRVVAYSYRVRDNRSNIKARTPTPSIEFRYEKVSDKVRLLDAVKCLCESKIGGFDRVLALISVCRRVLRT